MCDVLKFKYIFLSLIFFILISSFCQIYAATSTTPTLVNKINSAFKRIKEYIEKISIPIAGVCIASGFLIRKLSFGDEKKMILGKNIIINSIIGYAAIQSLDLIIKFVDTVIK